MFNLTFWPHALSKQLKIDQETSAGSICDAAPEPEKKDTSHNFVLKSVVSRESH